MSDDKKACDDHAKHNPKCHNCSIITGQAARVAFNMRRAEEAERALATLESVAESRLRRIERLEALLTASLPIRDYYVKRAAWDGGGPLPVDPTSGQVLDFVNAVNKATGAR